MPAERNPYSTRFTRPGALRFLFPIGTELQDVVNRLHQEACIGQIVGPHGSGKSTLLHALVEQLRQEEIEVSFLTFHAGDRIANRQAVRELLAQIRSIEARSPMRRAFAIDGIEQLWWWTRRRIIWECRKRSGGLIVTSHDSVGLPTLWKSSTSPELIRELIRELKIAPERRPSDSDIDRLWKRHKGNLREVLFELYDWYEGFDRTLASYDRSPIEP